MLCEWINCKILMKYMLQSLHINKFNTDSGDFFHVIQPLPVTIDCIRPPMQ